MSQFVFKLPDLGEGTVEAEIVGGLVEIVFGIDAEGKPLEEIAAPLSEVDS